MSKGPWIRMFYISGFCVIIYVHLITYIHIFLQGEFLTVTSTVYTIDEVKMIFER